MGNEPELIAGRALNELRQLKLEPRAATLAAHLIDVLRGDRTPLLLVDLDPADGRGFRWRDFQLYAADEQRSVGGLGSGLLHDQIPQSRLSAFQKTVAERQPPASGWTTLVPWAEGGERSLVLGSNDGLMKAARGC